MNLRRWNSLAGAVDMRTVSMLGILAALAFFFRAQVGEMYFSGESISKLSRDMAPWTILAAGMTLVIITGNIDLSVGSLLALVGAVCAFVVDAEYGLGLSPTLAVCTGLLLGVLLGALQGALTAYARIPSFIVTLGGMFVFRGLTQRVSQNDPRLPTHSWLATVGIDYVPAAIGLVVATAICVAVVVAMARTRGHRGRLGLPVRPAWSFAAAIALIAVFVIGTTMSMNSYRGIPAQTIVMLAVLTVLAIVMRSTVFGRRLYAIGGNAEAARLAGIHVKRHTLAVFTLMGLCAAIAGIVLTAQNQGATKNAGETYELYAIAAAVIGGTSLMGGKGTIIGTFLGGLIMAVLIQGMDYSSLDNWMQLVVRGAVVVLAVGIDPSTREAFRSRGKPR
jgi:D-xylose transport system permease protein